MGVVEETERGGGGGLDGQGDPCDPSDIDTFIVRWSKELMSRFRLWMVNAFGTRVCDALSDWVNIHLLYKAGPTCSRHLAKYSAVESVS